MAIELRGFDDLKDDLVNMAYALDEGPGVNRAPAQIRRSSRMPFTLPFTPARLRNGAAAGNRSPSVSTTRRTALTTPTLWSLDTEALLLLPRILLSGLPLIPGPMRPTTK